MGKDRALNVRLPTFVWPSGVAIEYPEGATLDLNDDYRYYVKCEHPDTSGNRLLFDQVADQFFLLRVVTHPSSAKVFLAGEELGVSPVRVPINGLPKGSFDGTNACLGNCYAVWKSGVKSAYTNITISLSEIRDYGATIQRITSQPTTSKNTSENSKKYGPEIPEDTDITVEITRPGEPGVEIDEEYDATRVRESISNQPH